MTIRKGETPAEYYARIKDKALAQQKAWLAANPGKSREYARRYREGHPEKKAEWQRKNPEKVAAKGRRWRAAHSDALRDKAREYAWEWRRKNQEHVCAYASARRAAAVEVFRERERRRCGTERRRISKQAGRHTRKARIRGAPGRHTAREWAAKLAEFDNCCAWCGADGKMTCDHVVPVARGGSNAIGNVVPACGTCNTSKLDRDLVEWLTRRERLGATLSPFAWSVLMSGRLAEAG